MLLLSELFSSQRKMASEEHDSMMLMCDSLMWKCWPAILPSTSPKFLDLTDRPKHSVGFALDQNTIHVLPSVQDLSPDLYISEQEQEATRLEMNDTVTYFRRVFMLESRPKDAAAPKEEVSTIGLEWRIWPDGRFERREEIQRVVMDHFMFRGSLAVDLQPISKVSEELARRRAERVLRDLKQSPKPKQEVSRKYDRWMGINSWMRNISLLRQE